MIIHLIRHTTPLIEPGICYGQTDLDLAPSFEDESAAVLAKLNKSYDVVYTSPLQRCTRLAEKIAAPIRVTDERLVEYNFGDWELRPWSEFKSTGDMEWMENFVDQPAPNGDSMLSMQQRVDSFYTELIEQKLRTAAVVTHSGVQRLLHAFILATPMSHVFRLQLDFGAILELQVHKSSGLQTIKHL